MSFLLFLLAVATTAAAAWLLYQRLADVETQLQKLREAVEERAKAVDGSTSVSATPALVEGLEAGGQPQAQQRGPANPFGRPRQAIVIPGHEGAADDAMKVTQEAVVPGGELPRDIRDLSGTSPQESTIQEPARDTAAQDPSGDTDSQLREESASAHDPRADTGTLLAGTGAASTSPLDLAAVKSLYENWVRKKIAPVDPPGWEVVPLRFVRIHQEHAAAVPVYLFEDAGQIGDFVRFSRAGDAEAYVLPHPDAAHNPEHFALVFPEASPTLLNNTRSLTALDPVRMRRSGQYWQSQ